ncbi:DinB family protein [Sediminibacterium goheungense]|uniref:DinB family protein n=1 Tax=Sediminibacterium goheungense TaxID=1086393 RepID=A0A4R6J2L3_9BACT|nr:DinB family protein [Sediminibacterium goheungense]TDO29021.1 hypothetical protein BC659_1103 [Sediminibacterium goheungense]
MQIAQAIRNVFVQLHETLDKLTPEQYTACSKSLFNATIGQHVRHIVELFQCLEQGYETGTVNYERRKRDKQIETDKNLAIRLLHQISGDLLRADKKIQLEMSYDDVSNETITVESNYYREVVYNLEHTVHHMALIRVGVAELSDIQLPEGFGVASSTIKHREKCVQ